MKTPRHEASGFSLLELMVVVGIVGLLMAITIPAIGGLIRSSRITGATNMLAADLRYARELASEQRRTYAVSFGSNTYKLIRLSPVATVRTRTMPLGVACTASDTAKFYAWGLTSPTTITVSNQIHSTVMHLSASGSVSHD